MLAINVACFYVAGKMLDGICKKMLVAAPGFFLPRRAPLIGVDQMRRPIDGNGETAARRRYRPYEGVVVISTRSSSIGGALTVAALSDMCGIGSYASC